VDAHKRRENSELFAIQQSERFDHLDATAKALLQALLSNDNIFTSKFNTQTTTITGLHVDTMDLIRKEANKTRAEIINAICTSQCINGGNNQTLFAQLPKSLWILWQAILKFKISS
jgi:hypothetical protein